MKKIIALLLALSLALSLAACGSTAASSAPAESVSEAENTPEAEVSEVSDTTWTYRIAGMKGPTSMGMVNLMEVVDAGESNQDYQFSMYGAADEIVPLLVKGELDMAAIPANLAATLYKKTEGGIQVVAVNTLGVLYVVTTGDEINSVADLAGRTILSTGKGTTPEYILRYILTQNGIDPDTDVTIDFKSEASEVLSAMQLSSGYPIAVLPQPYVTTAMMQMENLKVALDLTEEWDKVTGNGELSDAMAAAAEAMTENGMDGEKLAEMWEKVSDARLVTGVMVARKEFVESNPGALDAFLSDYEASISAANTDVEHTAQLCETYGIVPKAAVAQKALPNCNIHFMSGEEMKSAVEGYLTVLYFADPAAVGGDLPDEDFYYLGK